MPKNPKTSFRIQPYGSVLVRQSTHIYTPNQDQEWRSKEKYIDISCAMRFAPSRKKIKDPRSLSLEQC
jgi:hypothetical protein